MQPLGPLGICAFPTVAIADPLLAQGGVIQRLDNNRMRHAELGYWSDYKLHCWTLHSLGVAEVIRTYLAGISHAS